MQEFFEKLLEHAKANPGEFLTGVATLLLVVATALLVRATNILSKSAKEDSLNRKIQATVDAWMKVRSELDLPHLTKETPEKELRAQLRTLEAFSVGVNSGVYDLATFKKMSGNWYCQQFNRIKPIIDERQKKGPDAYRELASLAKAVEEMRPDAANEPAGKKCSERS
ncbi:DUF4760 domain-containing protein [Bradyrhizobium zhanjiangense]|uniref:DUF4760 domain-containing protein n=1 Tax=Bradyrhizobium zhanjiangense TaxID=1325107 RepID=A0A4Q0SIA2_9BRAD|nr:hypothetical protein [Bradyrhizobium zhanjiangense]RXH37989.1 hypothetical protein XH94_23680 [Bradyrhizobium zhanjiangense]